MPSSTRPSRGIAPARNSSCSASVVLPAPAWPARTTLRRWGRSTLFIVIGRFLRSSLAGGTGRWRRRSGPGRGRGADARGRAMIVGYTPARDVRTFQVVHDQAPEGRQRRQARRAVHQGRARDRGRRARRRRGPGRQLPAAPGDREGPRGQHAGATTSSGPSTRRPAAARPSSSRRSSTRATARAASPSSSRPPPTTATAPRRTSARCSPRPAASSPAAGAVAWQFEPRGLISVPRDGVGRRRGRPGGDRCRRRGRGHRGRTRSRSTPSRAISRPCARRSRPPGITVESAESAMIAEADGRARRASRAPGAAAVELLEDLDDVQRVTANFDIPEDVFAEVAG